MFSILTSAVGTSLFFLKYSSFIISEFSITLLSSKEFSSSSVPSVMTVLAFSILLPETVESNCFASNPMPYSSLAKPRPKLRSCCSMEAFEPFLYIAIDIINETFNKNE